MTSPAAAPLREIPYGHRARIGYTSPPLTTEVFPYEFYRMVPAGVTLVITTLAIVVRSKEEVDQSYDISMKAAREMAAAGVDIIVLGGVPINLSRGSANAQQGDGQGVIIRHRHRFGTHSAAQYLDRFLEARLQCQRPPQRACDVAAITWCQPQ